MTLQLAILASGSGSNVQAILEAVDRGVLDAAVRIVLSNRPDAPVLERARQRRVPCLCLEQARHSGREQYDAALVEAIGEAGADTVALAGYMRLLTPCFLRAFPGRVLNIHPSLLPAFPGATGVADAVAWGVKIAGCTVHFVEEAMDSGPVIIQAALPCLDQETSAALQSRIHDLEHRIFPQALQWLAEGRLIMHGREVRLARAKAGVSQTSIQSSQTGCLIHPPLEAGF